MRPELVLIGVLATTGATETVRMDQGACHVDADAHTVSCREMSVTWTVVNDELELHVVAATAGWVFVGFTEGPGLDGAHWVAMRVKDGRAEAHERVTSFAFPPPFHRPRADVDGENRVRLLSGEEHDGKSAFTTRIRLPPEMSGEIIAGKSSVTMHLALSESDDWHHHSRMRTSVTLRL